MGGYTEIRGKKKDLAEKKKESTRLL